MKRVVLNYLKIKIWNVHGLFTQINGCRYSKLNNPEFCSFFEKDHIFALIETWHSQQDVDALEIPGYKCYSVCRPRNAHTKGRPSGGIAVYIKDFLRNGITKCQSKSTEDIFLKLKKRSQTKSNNVKL